jgi:UDP-glucose 4-epimerase
LRTTGATRIIRANVKILVTGASGCLGGRLADELSRRGHAVIGVDVAQPVLRPGVSMEFVQGSFGASEIPPGVDAVAHLACSSVPATSAASPEIDVAENVLPSVELFQRAVRAGVRRIAFTSSGGTVYGDLPAERTAWRESDTPKPTTAHGAMKLTLETYLRAITHGTQTTPVVARIGNVYGRPGAARPGHGAVDSFVRAVLRDAEITVWGDGSAQRDYVHAGDVVAALIAMLEAERPSPVYNVSTGCATSLRDLIALVEAACGRRARVRYVPSRGVDLDRNVLDPTLARTELGWSSQIGLAEGAARVAEAVRDSVR